MLTGPNRDKLAHITGPLSSTLREARRLIAQLTAMGYEVEVDSRLQYVVKRMKCPTPQTSP